VRHDNKLGLKVALIHLLEGGKKGQIEGAISVQANYAVLNAKNALKTHFTLLFRKALYGFWTAWPQEYSNRAQIAFNTPRV
jgi:hypothetical protein